MGIGGSHAGRGGRLSGGGPDAFPPLPAAAATPPEPAALEPPDGAPASLFSPPALEPPNRAHASSPAPLEPPPALTPPEAVPPVPPRSPELIGSVVLSPPHARTTAPTMQKLDSTLFIDRPPDPRGPQLHWLRSIATAMFPPSAL